MATARPATQGRAASSIRCADPRRVDAPGYNEALRNEEPFSEERARDVHAVAELVLQRLFTLPRMPERAKDTAGAAAASGDTATAD